MPGTVNRFTLAQLDEKVGAALERDVEAAKATLQRYQAACETCRPLVSGLLRKAGGGPIEESSLSARFCEHIKAVLGDADPGTHKRPSLHETRSLSARTYVAQGMDPRVVQTLLGHSDIEMTELYLNDRGLSAHQWKRVEAPAVD